MEAALNLLREQLRVVRDVRLDIEKDDELRLSDPGHRRDLLEQTQREIGQMWRAIQVLEGIERGELITVPVDAPRPAITRAPPPARQTGLRAASPPEPRPIGPPAGAQGGRRLEFRGTV